MAKIEVSLSNQLDMRIDQLVEDGEFLNRQEAISELLENGLRTYQTTFDEGEEGDLAFAEEMRNPGDEDIDADEDYGI